MLFIPNTGDNTNGQSLHTSCFGGQLCCIEPLMINSRFLILLPLYDWYPNTFLKRLQSGKQLNVHCMYLQFGVKSMVRNTVTHRYKY